MDDANLQAQVAQHGPQLIHWVASVPDVAAACTALSALDMDRGAVITASRPTPHGLLQWQITVRPDGRRLFDGCLPTLIEWGATHPAARLPPSGVTLHALRLKHPRAAALAEACKAAGLGDTAIEPAPQPAIEAVLATPRGVVTLSSIGQPRP